MHALALHVGAGFLPHGKRFRIVAEDDADLFEHRVGIVLDQRQAFLVEHFVDLDRALDIGELRAGTAAGARRAPRRRAAARARPRRAVEASCSAAAFSFIEIFPG